MRKILITRDLPDIAEKILNKNFDVAINTKDHLTKKELIYAVENYDGILCTIPDRFDREILSHSKKLKVLSNYAVGLDNIDVNYAHERGITVVNLPGIVTSSTADLTFAIFLSLIRKIGPAQQFVKDGKWKSVDPNIFLGEELQGKTFGIIGLGRIGRAVAKRALGFGLKVIYFNRSNIENKDLVVNQCQKVTLDTLLKNSDYISLHIPLNTNSKGLLDINIFSKMSKKPILINTARGAVVNTEDLVIALKKGYIRGVALDVVDPEPFPSDHPLLSFENCSLVPHIGTATMECREKMAEMAAINIINTLNST